MLSFEFPLGGKGSLAPPTSEDDPPDDDIDDKSCTSNSDSCELVLISKLDKLLFFTFNRFALIELGASLMVDCSGCCCCSGGDGRCCCCCWWHCCCCCGISVLSSCWEDAVLTSGAVLTDPTDIEEEDGELTIKSKLSSVELIEVLLKFALSLESMLLLIDEQQLSSMVEECVRADPPLGRSPPAPLMNRFTSRSGLSIEVDEMTESFNVLLGEFKRVCLGFGVGGAGGVVTVGGGRCGCVCCCSGCCC